MPSRRSSVLNLFDPLVICTTKSPETSITSVTPVHATSQDNNATPARPAANDSLPSPKDQISLTAFFNRTFSRPKETKKAISSKPPLSRLMEPLVELSDEPETPTTESPKASLEQPQVLPLIEFGSPEVIQSADSIPNVQAVSTPLPSPPVFSRSDHAPAALKESTSTPSHVFALPSSIASSSPKCITPNRHSLSPPSSIPKPRSPVDHNRPRVSSDLLNITPLDTSFDLLKGNMSFLGAADSDMSSDFDPPPPMRSKLQKEVTLPEPPAIPSAHDMDMAFGTCTTPSSEVGKSPKVAAPLNGGLLVDIEESPRTPVRSPGRSKGAGITPKSPVLRKKSPVLQVTEEIRTDIASKPSIGAKPTQIRPKALPLSKSTTVNITANEVESHIVQEKKKVAPAPRSSQENATEEKTVKDKAPAPVVAPKHKAQRVPVSSSASRIEPAAVGPVSGRTGGLVRAASTVGGAKRILVKGSLPPSSYNAREDLESNSNISRPSKLKPAGLARASSITSIRGKAGSPDIATARTVHKGSIPRPISMASRLPGPSGGLRRVATIVGKAGTTHV
ncbi:hypothetical protein SISNIDRAFT_550542 [Sistotremastrum niveocremeum HHB9708]|uniref:Uncharacterized protein n=2 Tax=Sistotremastraceae TaxID=3402574 RepID=A0A164TQE8_9AGAM|nr:hypothetical protein SISNIDRAFT_550542 [Sistotremastrum niveocremeum HHB9708]KZT42221.1 hypothetical protein SISSUDRAFT_1125887 [Sistotremastrum suecicum HHB10207 ss-3]